MSYESRKFALAEMNYPVTEKELLAVVQHCKYGGAICMTASL
jgi:hypothetical protein